MKQQSIAQLNRVITNCQLVSNFLISNWNIIVTAEYIWMHLPFEGSVDVVSSLVLLKSLFAIEQLGAVVYTTFEEH